MTQMRRPGLVNKWALCHQEVSSTRWMELFSSSPFAFQFRSPYSVGNPHRSTAAVKKKKKNGGAHSWEYQTLLTMDFCMDKSWINNWIRGETLRAVGFRVVSCLEIKWWQLCLHVAIRCLSSKHIWNPHTQKKNTNVFPCLPQTWQQVRERLAFHHYVPGRCRMV